MIPVEVGQQDVPRKAPSSSVGRSGGRCRRRGPASGVPPAGVTATHEVLPPTRTNARPGPAWSRAPRRSGPSPVPRSATLARPHDDGRPPAPPAPSGRAGPAGTIATFATVSARRVDVPGPSLQQPARRGWRPGRPRPRRPRRPRPTARRRAAGTPRRLAPCSVSTAPALSFRIVGFAPPRMMRSASSRSSAVSTAVTSAGESSSPQGVWAPKALRHQSLKSAMPDLAASLPSAS